MIIILTDITFGMVRQCNKNWNEAWKALIYKYAVSDEKLGSLNEVTNRWTTCRIKYTSQDPDIWFNELYNLNFQVQENQGKIWERWRWDEGTCIWCLTRRIQTCESILKLQRIEDDIQGPQERNPLVLENRVRQNQEKMKSTPKRRFKQ